MQLMFLLEQVVNGLVLGGYYLLIALGLSLIFSVGGIVNLAHGAFYAFGAYAPSRSPSISVSHRRSFFRRWRWACLASFSSDSSCGASTPLIRS